MRLEYCDIDQEPDERQLDQLDRFDIIYLSGGDPIGFRLNLLMRGLDAALRACATKGRLIVAASGGAMQFTKNVSLFRLLTSTVQAAIAERDAYEAIGMVDYELLPHLNRHGGEFLEKVRRYSEQVPHDIVALDDGAAILHDSEVGFRCDGHAARFRRGQRAPVAET